MVLKNNHIFSGGSFGVKSHGASVLPPISFKQILSYAIFFLTTSSRVATNPRTHQVTAQLSLPNTTFATHDITTASLPASQYDGWYSILVFLHIPREPRLRGFKIIADSIKAGGLFCIEDYVLYDGMEGKMTAEEKFLLEEVIGAVYVPTVCMYRKQLEEAGFEDVQFEDLTDVWTKWTVIRRDEFLRNREQQVGKGGGLAIWNTRE